jgi:glycosidase
LVGRVTGDNEVSWRPGEQSWYETVKLNYGFDFSQEQPVREFPHAGAPDKPVPDTWTRMDEVITWWQRQGVDGFRCDMAHMVPPEFWSWLIGRARERQPDVYFTAEAYNGDARKVRSADPVLAGLNHGEGHVKFDLLNAGFDSVYDDDTYWQLRKIYEGDAWANDLDRHTTHPWLVQNTLTYVENHDEVRVASKKGWGGHGMETGRAASGLLLGMSCGPVLIYNGQEVGEPAEGKEGFSGDDGRTTIFDYWSMPEWVKWVNGGTHDGGRLSQQQKDLRHFYASLLRLLNEPAFREGNYFPLNAANGDNPQFGRLGGEGASGHWLFAYIRADRITGQRFLVVVNLHPSETMYDVRIRIPGDVLNEAGFGGEAIFTERLSTSDERTIVSGLDELGGQGLPVGYIPPLTPFYFEATGQ